MPKVSGSFHFKPDKVLDMLNLINWFCMNYAITT